MLSTTNAEFIALGVAIATLNDIRIIKQSSLKVDTPHIHIKTVGLVFVIFY